MYPFSALLIPLLFIPFTTEVITGCINEATKGPNKAGRNPPSCFLFYVLLFQQYHQFFKVYLLHLKLNYLLSKVNYLQLKEKQGLLLLFYLNYLKNYKEISTIESF